MIRRSGYTLLEVLLAVGIGLLLVAALYVALDVQMRYMQSGRQLVAEAQLARGVLNRIASDVRAQMALLPTSASLAMMQQEVDAQASSSASSSTGSSSTGSASGTGGGSGGGASGTEATEQPAEDPSQAAQVNFGVQGDSTTLVLCVNATPRYSLMESQSQLTYSDQRRVTYLLQPGLGLLREETRGVLGTNLGPGDTVSEVIAPEVAELQFRYFDPASGGWMTEWDGTYQGPPLAIEILLTLQPPLETMTNEFANRPPTQHRLVISVPTAAILPQPTATGSTTGSSTTGGTNP